MITLSKIERLYTYVERIKQDREGNITLFYLDGTTKTASLPDIDISKGDKLRFLIVRDVERYDRILKGELVG